LYEAADRILALEKALKSLVDLYSSENGCEYDKDDHLVNEAKVILKSVQRI
jgi:hypothetical protein